MEVTWVDHISWFHGVQLVVFFWAVGLAADRARVLLYQAPLDFVRFRPAVEGALRDGDLDAVHGWVLELRPAWAARVVETAVTSESHAIRRANLDEELADVHGDAFARLHALRGLGSVSTMLGFLGAMVEIIYLFSGDHGLLGLQRGLVEEIAVGQAALSVGLGIGGAIVAFGSLVILRKHASRLVRECERVANVSVASLDG